MFNYSDWKGPSEFGDWSSNRSITAIRDNEEEILYYQDFDSWFDSLSEPTLLVVEATFENFEKQNRQLVIDRAKREGHVFRTIGTRCTNRVRRAGGEDKTDEVDVRVIRHRVKSGAHLHDPDYRVDKEYQERFDAAQAEIRNLRYMGKKELLAQNVIKRLPEIKLQPETRRVALTSKSSPNEYNEVRVAAVTIAAKYSRDIKEFERIAGLYENGYPSQIRADLMYHGWRNLRKWATIKFSDYRRELRWLYRQINAVLNGQELTPAVS